MARINIDDNWWTDPRRVALIKLGIDADGVAIRAWRLAQDHWKKGKSLIPAHLFRALECHDQLISSGMAEVRDDGIYIRGSEGSFQWMLDEQDARKAGGKKSAKGRKRDSKGRMLPSEKGKILPVSNQLPPTATSCEPAESMSSYSSSSSLSSSSSSSESGSGFKSSDGVQISPAAALSVAGGSTGETWRAYSEAYRSRHGTLPVRNAAVNGQLAQFVKRLGGDAAPDVAAFYVGHNDRFYVQAMHSVGLLLRDAEKLHTEWITGRRMTNTEARQVDQKQTLANAFAPLLAEAKAREAGHG